MDVQAFLTASIEAANPELVIRFSFQVVLLIASAFFSGSETALFSLSRLDLQKLRTTRNPRSDKIHELLDEPRRLIISILCGNELVNIASSANMAAILVTLYGEGDTTWINIIIMVPLLLLVGEVTPKTFAVTFPIKFAANLSARLLPKWILLITPLRNAVRLVADRITTFVVGEAVKSENILGADEFRTLIEEGEETGVLDATERVLIDNMLAASETEIISIMTPRTRISFLNADQPVPDIIEQFRHLRHPRVPVTRGSTDSILGVLRSEDVLRIMRKGVDLESIAIEDLLKPAHFVPPTKKVDEMFDYFQRHNTRAAIILGEFGGVMGMVTMKDVLTFIFGEISGHLKGQELYQEVDDNTYTVPGDMRLANFNNLTAFAIEDPLMTTIGGFAFRLFDRLPKVGDSTVYEGIRLSVLQMDQLRIKTLEVTKTSYGDNNSERAEPSPLAHLQATEPETVQELLEESAVAADSDINDEPGRSTTPVPQDTIN